MKNSIKKLLSVLILGLLIGLMSQICFATEESNLHGSIELVGYFERINGQEWNLKLWYDLTDEVKIGIRENIHQYQEWQGKDNEYNTEIFLIYRFHEELELYFVPLNTQNEPYFKIKYEF
jgi:hypothetical protein